MSVTLDFPTLVQGTDEWKELRSAQGATCSCFGNAFGVGYISRIQYMKRKLKLVPSEPCNEIMQFGLDYEDWCIAKYKELMESKGYRIGMRSHGYRRFALDTDSGGSPDRLVTDLDTGQEWVLEIKTRLHHGIRDYVPESHLLQCVGLSRLYNAPFTDYMCWAPDDALFVSRITHHPEFWYDYLWPAVTSFNDLWRSKTLPGRMPAKLKQQRQAAMKRFINCTHIPNPT